MATGLGLKTVNVPDAALTFTNKVFMSAADIAHLCGQGAGPKYIECARNAGGTAGGPSSCIFTVEMHPKMEQGTIAFNKVHREWARIAVNAEVFVKGFKAAADAELGMCTIECDHFQKVPDSTPRTEIKEEDLEPLIRKLYVGQVFSTTQPIAFDFNSTLLRLTIQGVAPVDMGEGTSAPSNVTCGVFTARTELDLTNGTSGKFQIQSNKVKRRNIFTHDFDFASLGIGGLDKEFGDIFRRVFASRVYPEIAKQAGMNHVKGMLLWGPPGTGKTLVARQLAKFLNAAEPKIVNGPEILNKYVGASEENIRKLFADAEKEQKALGDNSQLHIVIFDEFDAICKSRGTKNDSTGVSDSIVNQLLSKIDGVDALNNILLIGMTNRKDLIDEAILRPGRLEAHVEISLPDEKGRVQILNIHTKKMKAGDLLDKGVSIAKIAANTKNYSGAELEGLVRAATSFAFNREVNIETVGKSDKKAGAGPKICVSDNDFEQALLDVKPAFGFHEDDFELCIGPSGIIPYSAECQHLITTCESLVEQVRGSENTPLMTVLLSGMHGSGKTALAAHLAQKSDYPFVRRVANEQYVGYAEHAKVNAITKVFEDAYKSKLSVIVLDDIERLMDYVRIGPRFSNGVLQMLFALLKKLPPKKGRKLLVIASTSDPQFLEEAELANVFNVRLNVPVLQEASNFKHVLGKLDGFTPEVVEALSSELSGEKIGIRTLLLVAEMAVQRQTPVTKEVFMQCLGHVGVRR
jgi:vesicle-fusing ATPase